MDKLFSIKKLLNKILSWLEQRVESSGAQYIAFGIFGIINYPLSYFMWRDVIPQIFNPFSLRLVAGLLCIPLIFHKYWPNKYKHLLPCYWYLTILYCLPFFGTYMLLMNHLSNAWLMNMVIGLFLFILLVDWLMFILLLTLGAGLGYFFYSFSSNASYIIDPNAVSLAIYLYGFSIVIGTVFSRNKEKIIYEKLHSMRSLAGIVHELRTPLATLQNTINGIKRYFKPLINGYLLAAKNNLPVENIRPQHFETLSTILDDAETEIHYSNTIIDMLLIKINTTQGKNISLESCSMTHCINEAIRRYPFSSEQEMRLIHWEAHNDFIFYGKELLMVHVLFNLIKNALFYINVARKGEIKIWLEQKRKYNELHIQDTGKGVPKDILPKLFTLFFTTSENGTGLGLAFCKMVMVNFGGNISCKSQEGVFTEFVLKFPNIS